jgi:tyrosinase
MKKLHLLLVITFLYSSFIFSQAIRKNYIEMTETEKVNLVNAFYQLRLGPDLMNDIATFHADFFNFENSIDPNGLAIHNNLPDRPENEIFLAWHRRQMFEVEQAMQDINPNISIPFWDSSVDQSINSALWDQNFLGQFDVDWGLNRDFGNPIFLPTPQDVLDVQANTDFLLYANDFERGTPHVGAHQWIGGAMSSGLSPSDPVFYLHHSNVDRLWSEWQEINQNSAFQRTSMIRYDGTYNFDGQIIPLINPNDIVDTRFYGTFYANNGLAQLDKYTVSNSYNIQENFYYQFTIQAGSNFLVPSGTDCKLESVNEIILLPGFDASSGSNFIAKIDNTSNTVKISKRGNEIVRNKIPYSSMGVLPNAYDDFYLEDAQLAVLNYYPNPFTNEITIQLNKQFSKSEIVIYDIRGRTIRNESFNNSSIIEMKNLSNLTSGIYIIHVFDENSQILLSKKFVKM